MPEPTLTAQQIFDSIKAGDEALRQRVNRAAAEACGYVVVQTFSGKLVIEYPAEPSPEGGSWTPPPKPLPDVTRDLTACAGLRLPKGWFRVGGEADGECIDGAARSGVSNNQVRYAPHTPADEALARVACWYMATHGGDDAKRS